jgi:glycerol-3-phosphate dehydrogenase
LGLTYDLAIVGGGINGCGIARDAAGRGLSVFLCEQSDLGSATSSASTKLIHGGLRYLEHYEFRLVREALIEREVLLRMAPHIIRPLRFVLPHCEGLRPAWLIRLGLFLYDHLGARKLLPGTRTLNLARDTAGRPLKPEFRRAFEYSDCWVDDARLVILNAVDAAQRGADIRPRTRCVAADRAGDVWRVVVEHHATGSRQVIEARALINAAGPWVQQALGQSVHTNAPAKVRLVKGSHIVVRKIFDHDRAYIFQNGDGRIIFAIPYEHDFTLIGTTDRDFIGDPADVHAGADEVAYLCAVASEYFTKPIAPADVVWTYSGVRPLYDDGASKAQEATRDYVLKLDAPPNAPPLLTIFGGKITTYRRLAEAALEKLSDHLALKAPWTAAAPLPGGDFPPNGIAALTAELQTSFGFLPPSYLGRLARAYGTRARLVLGNARNIADLGRHFGADLYEVELVYLMNNEWAETALDVLWRRSKLGLHIGAENVAALEDWMAQRATQSRAGRLQRGIA